MIINHPVVETDYYKKIEKIISDLDKWGILYRAPGYCLSMSDIILNKLKMDGISAELLECSLMVVYKDPPGIHLIGYDGIYPADYDPKNNIQNHIVCLVNTPIPLIVDLSTSHLDENVPYVIIPALKDNSGQITYDFGSSIWTYQEKSNCELPGLYQKSIIDRIDTDNKIESNINLIKKVLLIIITITFINSIRGFYDFYSKYIVKDNNWGPQPTELNRNK